MARYSLIMKDEVYLRLVQEAGRQGKTLGKFLNEVLTNFVRDLEKGGGMPSPKICIVCGRPASLVGFGRGQQTFYVCPAHRERVSGLNGYKEI